MTPLGDLLPLPLLNWFGELKAERIFIVLFLFTLAILVLELEDPAFELGE